MNLGYNITKVKVYCHYANRYSNANKSNTQNKQATGNKKIVLGVQRHVCTPFLWGISSAVERLRVSV